MRPWFIIDPRTSNLSNVIDMLTGVALIFTVIVAPFEVSFLTPPSDVDALFVCNRIVDAIFVIDVTMQFLIMYPTSGESLEGAKWEDDPLKIAKRYLTSWFLIDVVSIGVSSFDFYSVTQGASRTVTDDGGVVVMQADVISKFKLLRIVRVLRLVKLLRIVRASRILKRFETRVSINYGVLQILRIGSIAIAVAHLAACMWSLQTVLVISLQNSWVERLGYCVFSPLAPQANITGYDTSWLAAPGGHDGWWCQPPEVMYSACIYWSIATITSIG